ncbi:MAG: hypothetical protein A3I61_17385 [Acidobacteria bacterium RIFCSPLOWO2_02_FULL_68_18]|nr:MAG: hypothetical protein A3I61_17385 [Acidobacteria bacterium RIFCSPLOWO2_02_FULL_68_18]OFW50452.1 MAG: hypothetical protein A3G77_11960 [Acidobacteria bacterium RIFCSPLOWO2_12_FULL_68_19]
MNLPVARSVLTVTVVALVLPGLDVPALGQRPYYVTPPPGSGPTPMRPYGDSGGCSEEPALLHRCALEKAKTFTPPRTPDGVPDFQGYWARIGARNAENIEEHPEGMDGSGGRSLIVDPADGRIPYQPWARARVETHWATYWNPVQQCMPDTPPRQAYAAGALQIVQAPGFVFFMAEQLHTYRVIPTTPRPHLGSNIHLFMGDSRARWEGNTLVVDVTNLRDRVWLDHVGNTFSDSARLVERWTMFHPDVIHYQATIDDPKVFTRPWTMAFAWRRNAEPGFELLESACWEGVQVGQRLLRNELRVYTGGFGR